MKEFAHKEIDEIVELLPQEEFDEDWCVWSDGLPNAYKQWRKTGEKDEDPVAV